MPEGYQSVQLTMLLLWFLILLYFVEREEGEGRTGKEVGLGEEKS